MKKVLWQWLVFLSLALVVGVSREAKASDPLISASARLNDCDDAGCHKLPDAPGDPPSGAINGAGNTAFCPTCHDADGMARWWVDEPYINLHVVDEPLSYATSSGKDMAFRFTYKERFALPGLDQVPNMFNTNDGISRTYYDRYANVMMGMTGPDNTTGMTNASWAHNWQRSVLFWDAGVEPARQTPFQNEYEALVFNPDGSVNYFDNTTLFASSQAHEPISQMQLVPLNLKLFTSNAVAYNPQPDANGIYWGGTNGFKMVYPDGSQDLFTLRNFSVAFGPGDSTTYALLTERVDPQGRATQLGYEYTNFNSTYYAFRLRYVVDTDGRTNTLIYASGGASAWTLQEIDDPFGRKATCSYASGTTWLSGLTDTASNTSAFIYSTNILPYNFGIPADSGWMSELVTPYGTNQFFHYVATSGSAPSNITKRAVCVSEPDGAHQLFCYLHSLSNLVESSAISPSAPNAVFDDGTTGENDCPLYQRNSFHWDRQQCANLSTSVTQYFPYQMANILGALNSTELLKGQMQHWLLGADGASTTEIPSSERDPSPDPGGQTEGLRTWYAYTNATPVVEELTAQASAIAQLLPGGGANYTQYYYYSTISIPHLPTGYVSRTEQTYTTSGGGVGVLTNWFFYTNNTVDLSSASNSIGQVVNLGYNSYHQVTSITNALNQVTTLTYVPGTQNLTAVTNYSGHVLNLAYFTSGSNTSGFLNTINVLPEGLGTTISDYTNGLPRVVQISGTGLNSLTVSNTWDNLNRLTGTLYPDGTTESNTYSILDLAAHTDRLGNTTHFVHDALQHLIYITNALNKVTAYTWCSCGSLTSVTDPLTNVTTLDYNNQSLLTNVIFPDGSSYTNQYDLLGRLTNRVDGAGHAVSLTYNNQSLVTAISNAYGQLLGLGYDAVGNPISVTNADGVVFTRTYDILNRIITNAWPDGSRELFQYSTNGLIAYTNQDGQVTRFYRDGSGRVTNEVNNLLQTNQFAFDARDHLTGLIDGLGHSTTWQFNQYGWPTNKLNNLSASVQTNAYDADGRLTNRWLPATGSTVYKWDALGNRTNIIYPQSTNTYAYDAIARLTNMVDLVGTHSFTYTGTGQLASETAPWASDTITYAYSQGQRTNLSLTQPTGSWSQSYGYDSAWRLTSLTSPAGLFKNTYASSASGLVRLIALPNSASVTNYYDSLARLDYTALLNYWGHPLDGYSYQNDAWGLRTNITRQLGLTTNIVTASYDGIGELAGWTGKESSGTLRQNEQLAYGFDAANNLQYRTNGLLVQTFTDNSLNEISSITRSGLFTETGATPSPATNVTVNGVAALRYGDFTFASTNNTLANGNNTFTTIAQNTYGVKVTNSLTLNLPTPVSFQYDANGNLTNDGTRSFYFDAENQLTNVTVAGQYQVLYIYDGLRLRRIRRAYAWQSSAWSLTNEIRYIYDGPNVIQERDTNNNVLVTYTRGLDMSASLQSAGGVGGLLSRTDSNGATYYHCDANGNVTAITDSNGNIVARYEYDGFGRTIGMWGSLATANVYRFSSKEYDTVTGLYYFGGRYYDPVLQRWLNRDPIDELGGVNLYSFVGNNSVNSIDPDGLFRWGNYNPLLIFDPEVYEGILYSLSGSGGNPSRASQYSNRAMLNQDGETPGTLADGKSGGQGVAMIGGAAVAAAVTYMADGIGEAGKTEQCLKPVNLPKWKSIPIDMDHILSGHTADGIRAIQSGIKDLFPGWMTDKQIENAVRQAYRYGKKIQTQGDRVLIIGKSGNQTIEMWVNTATGTIETAYPQ